MTAPPAAKPGSPLVAIIVDTATSFEREILMGAAQYALEVGDWRLYVEEEPGERLPDLLNLGGDGIIASFDDPRVAEAVSRSGLPTVCVGGGAYHDPATGIPHVGTDEERVAALAVEHLRELGLRSFGFYGTLPSPTTAWSEARGRSFTELLAAAGMPCNVCTARHGTRDWRHAQSELQAWLTGLPKPVGIMACDDARGRHVIESCRALGLRVPHDVAVIGVDDNAIVCEFTAPTLSSIVQATRRIGHEAAGLLDRLMRPNAHGGSATVPTRLLIPPLGVVPRGSTQTRLVGDPLIGRVLERIQQHGCRSLTVARLGKEFGLSRWTLERRFKTAIGHSLHSHIAQQRLAEAQRLIRTTNLSLKAVAARAGFSSLSYMTTHFRRSLGLTPGRFRQLEQPPAVRLSGGTAPPSLGGSADP